MSAKQRKFKAEVQQLLDLVIHSLYSNREIFLRELISNASDAIDRARFQALSDQAVLEDDPEWKITLSVDPEAGTLTVSDNGIGMGAEDIDACIGTIASSGTRRFLEELRERREALPPELIGQFGVGFYAAFMVADKVTVISRHAGDPAAAVKWESEGAGSYNVEPTTRARRGTDVILHLKKEADEFLEPWRLQAIVRKFSDFVEHPVVMDVEHEETPTDAEGKPIPDAKPEKKVVTETLNSRKALWQRQRSEITPEEYTEFYRHISHDFQDPFETLHWNAEGATEFRALVFIPQRPPLDMFMGDERHRGVQLYVRRVFITDHAEGLVPTYLRFLRGVVDSADLPLNVSREMLQEHRILRTIRGNIVKKVLATLGDMMAKERERYITFWRAFGAVLKEGIHVDPENRAKIEDLALFSSSKTGPQDLVSLAEVVARMPEAQKEIYYITAEDYAGADGAPQLEAFRSRGFEVLYLTDTVDEWVVQNLTTYKDKPLRSVAKGDVDLDTPEEKQLAEATRKADDEHFKPLLDQAAAILGEKVKTVRLSRRLTESACCLVSDEFGIGLQLEKLLKAMHQEVPPARRILELNPKHPVVEAMRLLVDDTAATERLRDYVEMLHDQALLTARLPVPDPLVFAKRVSDLMAAQAAAPTPTAAP